MIDAYLEQSRRTKLASPALLGLYNSYYDDIRKNLRAGENLPKLHVVYSTERRCELVRVGGTDYLLYDQYLGQSFNRLNRVLLAKHSHSHLARGYACKYLAERLLTLGCYGLALFFAMGYLQFEEVVRDKGNPFALDPKEEALRLSLTAMQEVFVLAHELSHAVFERDKANFIEHIRSALEDFFTSPIRNAVAAEADEPHPATPKFGNYYRNILQGNEDTYLPELFADDFGLILATRVATCGHGTPFSACALGGLLAFKYTRLFRHLELLARALASLETVKDSDAFEQQKSAIMETIWDIDERRIQFYQLREHFLRYRLRTASHEWGLNPGDGQVNVGELADDYDDCIAGPVLFTLVGSLQKSLRHEVFLDLRKRAEDQDEAIRMIDKITRWDQSTDIPPNLRQRRS